MCKKTLNSMQTRLYLYTGDRGMAAILIDSSLEPTTANEWSCRQLTHSLPSPLSWATETSDSRWLMHHVVNEISNTGIYSLLHFLFFE